MAAAASCNYDAHRSVKPYTGLLRGARALCAVIGALDTTQKVCADNGTLTAADRRVARWLMVVAIVAQIVGLFDRYMHKAVAYYIGKLAADGKLNPRNVFKLFADNTDIPKVRGLAMFGVSISDVPNVTSLDIPASIDMAKATFTWLAENDDRATRVWNAVMDGEARATPLRLDRAKKMMRYFVPCLDRQPMYSIGADGAASFVGLVKWGPQQPYSVAAGTTGPGSPAFADLAKSRHLAVHMLAANDEKQWTQGSLLRALAVAINQARIVQVAINGVLGLTAQLPAWSDIIPIVPKDDIVPQEAYALHKADDVFADAFHLFCNDDDHLNDQDGGAAGGPTVPVDAE